MYELLHPDIDIEVPICVHMNCCFLATDVTRK